MRTNHISEPTPWHPLLFIPLAAIAGWGIAGTLAALNYQRLGKSARLWPTALLSWTTFSGFMLVVGAAQAMLQFSAPQTLVAISVANLIVGVVLCMIQRNEAKQWSAKHGKTPWQGGISLYSLLISMGIVNWILTGLPYLFLALFVLSLWATCTYFLTTLILQRGVGSLSFTQAQQRIIMLVIGLSTLCVLSGLCLGVIVIAGVLRYSQ